MPFTTRTRQGDLLTEICKELLVIAYGLHDISVPILDRSQRNGVLPDESRGGGEFSLSIPDRPNWVTLL